MRDSGRRNYGVAAIVVLLIYGIGERRRSAHRWMRGRLHGVKGDETASRLLRLRRRSVARGFPVRLYRMSTGRRHRLHCRLGVHGMRVRLFLLVRQNGLGLLRQLRPMRQLMPGLMVCSRMNHRRRRNDCPSKGKSY